MRALLILPILLMACERTSEATRANLARSVVYKYEQGQDENAQRQAVAAICGSSATITLLRGPVATAVPGEFESTYRCTY